MGVGWGEVWGLLGLAAVGVYVLWGPSARASRKKGLVPGLRNIGNACYLNALLQALATCAPLHAWLQGTDSAPGSEHGTNERMHNECHAHSGDAHAPGPCHNQEEVTHGGDKGTHSIDAGFSGIKADAHSNNTETHDISTDTAGGNADTRSINTDTRQMNTDTLDTNTETHGINIEPHGNNIVTHGINAGKHGIITDTQQIGTEIPSINTETYGIDTNAHSINTDTNNTNTHSVNTDTDDLHTDRHSNNTHNTDTRGMNSDTHDMNTYSTNRDTGSTVTHSVNVHDTNSNGTNPDSMNTSIHDRNAGSLNAGIQSIKTQNTQSNSKNTDNNNAHSAGLDTRTTNTGSNSKDSDRHRLNTDTRNNNGDTQTSSTETHSIDTRNTSTDSGGIDTEAHGNNIATCVISTGARSADTGTRSSQMARCHADTNMHGGNKGRHDTSTDTHHTNARAHSSDTFIRDANAGTSSTSADAHTSMDTDTEDKNIAAQSSDTDTRHTNTDIHCNNTGRRRTNAGTHATYAPASPSLESVASEVGEDPGLGSGRFIVRRSSESSARERRAPSGHLHAALLGMLRVLMGEGDAADAPVHAGPVLEALRSHGWEIPAHQEQDAHELFAVVMTTLEEERQGRSSLAFSGLQLQRLPMLESAGVVSRVTGDLHVPLAKTRMSPFLGRFAITLQCTRCKHKGPVRLESFESVSLPIPPNMHAPSVPLELCLESFFRSELLTGVKCDACSQTHPSGASIQADFLKRTLLAKLPQCVCIHLHRLAFSRDAHAYKEHGHVSFRSSLDLSRYTLQSELSKGRVGHCGSRFTLTAVVVHYGNSTSGHFVTYRSIPSGGRVRGRWVCCSDDEVRSVSLSEVLNSRAYLLFYTRT